MKNVKETVMHGVFQMCIGDRHGVVARKDGTVVELAIGEDPSDPVLGISDLLIHLSGEQLQKKAAVVVEGEMCIRDSSGAGAFSDGKLSLSYEVGGDLPTLIGEDFAQELINYTDKIYLEFGADEHVEGNYEGEEIKEIRKHAIRAGLQLVNCQIRHLGTEKAQQLYLNIQNYLQE